MDIKLPETGNNEHNITHAAGDLVAWILNDGKIGTLNQCLGLAEAIGLNPVIKIIEPRLPWRLLPSNWWFRPLAAQKPGAAALTPPWPDVVICCGRAAAAPTAEIGRLSQGRTKVIAVQDPRLDPARFDLIVVAIHDALRGPNVIVTEGALNRMTPAKFAQAASQFAPVFADLPRPLVAVLLGGTNAHYRLDQTGGAEIGQRLRTLSDQTGAGLVITPSRRTDPAAVAALAASLDPARSWVWNGEGDNPYFGMLALADHVLVTADSVSMASEAAATGKPIHILDLPGGGGKFGTFHERMRELGIARPFEGGLPSWSYAPLNDTARAAERVRTILGLPPL